MCKRSVFLIPKRFERDLRNHKYQQFNELLKAKRLPSAKLIGNHDSSHGFYIEKYKMPSGPRFIWKKITEGDKNIFVLRDFLLHDEYLKKYNSGTAANWESQLSLNDEENQELESLLKSLNNVQYEENDNLTDLSEAESYFLSSPVTINQKLFSDTVYETKSWLNYIFSENVTYMANYHDALLELIVESKSDNSEWIAVDIPNRKNEVIAVYHQIREVGENKINDWILFGVVPRDTDLKSRFAEIINNTDARYGTRRAYPYTMLEDTDFWQEMEKDRDSNIILSSEESDVIGSTPEYPMFISGRAGSGKSTVLQYLFAEILLRYLQSVSCTEDYNSISHPLYLSYSSSLIDKAKELMKSLFSKNHIYSEQLKAIDIEYEDIKPMIEDQLFCVFGELVHTLIDSHVKEGDTDRFQRDKRISFSEFKKQWQNKFDKVPKYRKYGPSICWHVIKTYIKGWNSRTYLTPEEYKGIGRDNKTVSDPVYGFVYNEVWRAWYSSLADEGFWDDQDLVRYCLHPSDDDPEETCIIPSYSAIFCDESQDFTRVELELILGLSTLSHKRLSSAKDLHKIPFVFAGDEFQTLSPTGFSWDSLRSFFTKELASQLKLPDSTISITEPLQLVNNYRSSGAIVRFGNLLQLLRGSRFQQLSLPQQTYFTDLGAPLHYFTDSKEIWECLKGKGIILIVPADDGLTLSEYIESTPLKNYIEIDESGSPKGITILNPAQAKGLDFENVAIYGFGHGSNLLTMSALKEKLCENTKISDDHISDKEIDAKYHLNNAYVAATRAKNHLFIIDTKIAESLWGIAIEDENRARLLDSMHNALPERIRRQWSDEHIGSMVKGTLQDITVDPNSDYEEVIQALEKRAIKLKDNSIMRQAALRYKERGKEKDYHRAQALCFQFDEQYPRAASEFEKAGFYDKAIDCYWLSITAENVTTTLERIRSLAGKTQTEKALLLYQISKAVKLGDIKDCIYKLAPKDSDSVNERNIRKILAEYLIERIPNVNQDESSDLKPMIELIKPLHFGKDFRISRLLNLLQQNKMYDEIIQLCETICTGQDYYPSQYYKAKIERTGYPDNLLFFEHAYKKDWLSKVYEQYKKHPGVKVSDERATVIIAQAVIECSILKNEIGEHAAHLLSIAGTVETMQKITEKLKSNRLISNLDEFRLVQSIQTKEAKIIYEKIEEDGLNKKGELYALAKKILATFAEDFKLDEKSIKNDGVSKYFDRTFKVGHSLLTTPYLLRLGELMEDRSQFLDAIHFYEWASKYAHSSEGSLFELLILKNEEAKQKLAKGEWEPILEKRRKLNIGILNEDLEKEIRSAKCKVWERIYKSLIERSKQSSGSATALSEKEVSEPEAAIDLKTQDEVKTGNVSGMQDKDTVPQTEETQEKHEVEKTDASTKPVVSTFAELAEQKLEKFKFKLEELEISFDFVKSRLVIRHPESSQQFSVLKRKIREDDEFEMDDKGRLTLEGTPLPYSVTATPDSIIINHLNSIGEPTGLMFTFPIKEV